MRYKITCCKDCSERHTACHDTCPKYLEEKAKNREEAERIYLAMQNDIIFNDMHYESVYKTKKRLNMR